MKHRFFTHITCKHRHGVSFARFYLTAISQSDYHASVQINGQLVLFDQLFRTKLWLALLTTKATISKN